MKRPPRTVLNFKIPENDFRIVEEKARTLGMTAGQFARTILYQHFLNKPEADKDQHAA